MSDTQTDTERRGFAAAIEGSYGTVVFGNGVPAKSGYVGWASHDHIGLEVAAAAPGGIDHETLVIPVSSIVYYRFANDAEEVS